MRIGSNKGFTLIELLIVVAIIGIIAAIAVPGLLRARIAGNEASAIGSLRAINSAQADFNGLNRGYAGSLEMLALTCSAVTVPFISADLNVSDVVKSGYIINLTNDTANADGPTAVCGGLSKTGYYATAVPEAPDTSGNRGFSTSTIMTIWQNIDGTGDAPTETQMAAVPSATVMPLGR